jgi:hypothetical protein
MTQEMERHLKLGKILCPATLQGDSDNLCEVYVGKFERKGDWMVAPIEGKFFSSGRWNGLTGGGSAKSIAAEKSALRTFFGAPAFVRWNYGKGEIGYRAAR